MTDQMAPLLSVSIRELAPAHVAFLVYRARAEQADLYNEINHCFRRVQEWAQGIGLDPRTLLTVGLPVVEGGRLTTYECCVAVPPPVQSGGEELGIKDLPGGHYAVVIIQKEPAVIGAALGRFYQEYVPHNHLQIDGLRPTYEIYYESILEYCVPVQPPAVKG